jgi:hypothetical protein
MILRFTIDHLRASRVAGTWLLARRLPGDIGRSAGDAVVRQVRSRGCPLIGLDRKWLAKGQNGALTQPDIDFHAQTRYAEVTLGVQSDRGEPERWNEKVF